LFVKTSNFKTNYILKPLTVKCLLPLFFSFLCILFIGCKKKSTLPTPDNSYGLPNATETGANIFACRANNESWISGNTPSVISGYILSDTLSASGSSGDNDHFQRLVLKIKGGIAATKAYQVASDSSVSVCLITDKNCQGFGSSIPIQYAINGKITLTNVDKVKKIFSGLFQCTIPVENCDTLIISNGRFDMHYN
jgi:hypothetical protein